MKPLHHIFLCFYYFLRPLLGPADCRFPLSCGLYAAKQLKNKGFIQASLAIGLRLLHCSPIGVLYCYVPLITLKIRRYSSSLANLLNSLRSLISR